MLRSAEFRRGREESWRELDDLVQRVEKRGINSVSADELQKMPLLYRSALSSLSVARSIALDRNLLRYLEGLTLRAYLVVYGPRTSLAAGLGRFLPARFPRRPCAGSAGTSWCPSPLSSIGLIAGYLIVNSDEEWFNAIVPDDLSGGRGPTVTAEELRNDGTLRTLAGLQGDLHRLRQLSLPAQFDGGDPVLRPRLHGRRAHIAAAWSIRA